MSDKNPSSGGKTPQNRNFGGRARDFAAKAGRDANSPTGEGNARGAGGGQKDSKSGFKNPKAAAQSKVQDAKETAKKKAVQAAAKSVGIPLSDKNAARVVAFVSKGIKVYAILAATFLMAVATFFMSLGEDSRRPTSDGVAEGSEVEQLIDLETRLAYQTSARQFTDPAGAPLPWSLAFAIGLVATDSGRFSPFDTCDRFPERGESALFPSGIPGEYTSGDCGPIGGEDEDIAVGPFLFAKSYADGKDEFQDFDFALNELNKLISETAKSLSEEDGFSYPASLPGTEEGLEELDAFWSEVVARLPISSPTTVQPCATPTPSFAPESVAGAIRDVWACELLRADNMTHVVDFDGSQYVTEPGQTAINRIISEAVTVASAWSGLGSFNSTQQMCGRTPIVGKEIGKPVVVVGDSLTVGARDLGDLEENLQAAGATEVSITAISGASADNASFTSVAVPKGAVVVIALGTNDTVGFTSEEFEVNLTALRDLYLDQGASEVVLVNIGKVGETDTSAHNTVIEDVARVAKAKVLDWSAWAGRNAVPYAGDGIHLTSEGYRMRSEYITERLLGNIFEESEDSQVPELVNGEKASGLEKSEYAGIFPMDEETFSTYNEVPDASRCDFGPNIHAAVRAFIADEQKSVDNRSTERGAYQPLLGGWEKFYSVADINFPVTGQDLEDRTNDLACKASIEEWVEENIAGREISVRGIGDSYAFFVYDEETNMVRPETWSIENPDSELVYDRLPAIEVSPLGECGDAEIGETSSEVTSYAAFVARESYLEYAEKVRVETPEENLDVGIDGSSIVDLVASVPSFEVADPEDPSDPAVLAASFYTAAQVLNHRAEQAAFGLVDVTDPSKTTALLRKYSSTGRSVQPSVDVIPMSTAASTPYSQAIVEIAVGVSGLSGLGLDSRSVASPFASVPRLSGRLAVTSASLATADAPYSLLDAVNSTIADLDAIYPGCNMDAAYLLATAYEESGSWWGQMEPGGYLDLSSSSSPPALGAFQLKQATYEAEAAKIGMPAADGNNDGVLDVSNAYDAARAAAYYQCSDAAENFDGNLLNQDTMWWVAMRYNDGKFPTAAKEQETLACRENGEHLKSPSEAAQGCVAEAYATQRVNKTNEYRAAMQEMFFALLSDPGYDPDTEKGRIAARAVTYALQQVGKPYCRPSNQSDPEKECDLDTITTEFNWYNKETASYELLPEPISGPGGQFNLGPGAYDCSGLTYASYFKSGMNIGVAYSHYQFTNFDRVEGELQPGDLLFYDSDNDGRTNHVVMYVGSGLIVHAASAKVGVVVDRVSFSGGYVGATRPTANYSEENATAPRISNPAIEETPSEGAIEAGKHWSEEGMEECTGTMLPYLFDGLASRKGTKVWVASEEFITGGSAGSSTAARHISGHIYLTQGDCDEWQKPADQDWKDFLARGVARRNALDLLAHEAAHAIDYFTPDQDGEPYGISTALEGDLVNLDFAHGVPHREMFAYCMQRAALDGIDLRGRCSSDEPLRVSPEGTKVCDNGANYAVVLEEFKNLTGLEYSEIALPEGDLIAYKNFVPSDQCLVAEDHEH